MIEQHILDMEKEAPDGWVFPAGYVVEARKGLYRFRLPDGSWSDLYNKTRVNEFLRLMEKGGKWEDIRIGYAPVDLK